MPRSHRRRGCPQAQWWGSTRLDRAEHDAHVFDDVARTQAGVVTRSQALALGFTKANVQAKLRSGRWRRVFTGVYATFNGPLPRRSLLWAAALKAGDGAVLSHETAAELAGLVERPAGCVHVTVPAGRTPFRIPGVVIHRSRRALLGRHPTRTPPQTRIEETVIDLTQTARRVEDAVGLLARAVGARLTTVDRLIASMRQRQRVRWRRLLQVALMDVEAGCHSFLELKYLREVERPHGLPTADRQTSVVREGRRRYDDVNYRLFCTRVELDGRLAHPDHERWRDLRRDNAAVVEGDRVLRYGLGDVDSYPCAVAAQVASVLHLGGWSGTPRPCGRPGCAFAERV